MNVLLKSASVKNFMKFENLKLSFDNKESSIYGANRVGKSCFVNSIYWCLYGKNTDDKAEFSIKRNNKGVRIPKIEVDVELIYLVDNKEVSFRRVLNEKIGITEDNEEYLKGHETKTWINDVPCKTMNEFNEQVKAIFKGDMFRLLSDPLFFPLLKKGPQVDWQRQRDFITSLTPSILDTDIVADMITKDKSYKVLQEVMDGGKDLEKRKVELKAKINILKTELNDENIKLAEKKRELPEAVDTSEILKKIKKLESSLKLITDSKTNALALSKRNSEKTQKIRDEITSLETKRFGIESKENEAINKKNLEASKGKTELKNECSELNNQIQKLEKSIAAFEKESIDIKAEMDQLRIDLKQVIDSEFVLDESQTTCPTCKRELDNVQEMKDELLENFNLDKAKMKDSMNSIGLTLKKSIEEKNTSLEESKSKLSELKTSHAKKLTEFESFEYTELKPDFTKIADWTLCNDKIDSLRKQLEEPQKGSPAIDDKAETDLKDQIADYNKQLGVNDRIQEDNARIDELEVNIKTISNTSNELKAELSKIEDFEMQKYTAIENNVNSMFKTAKFRLFKKNLTGNFESCCDILLEGVPFPDVNTEGKNTLGMDIINTFSKYYDLYLPITIDNRESITLIPDTKSQVINLFVDPSEKQLIIK